LEKSLTDSREPQRSKIEKNGEAVWTRKKGFQETRVNGLKDFS